MEGTIAEIRLFAGNFEPISWSFCNGQLLSMTSNAALYALIGTLYGGDGKQTFALPDLRGRVAVGTGSAPGLYSLPLGVTTGTEKTTLSTSNLPIHTHIATGPGSFPITGDISATMKVSSGTGSSSPTGNYLGNEGAGNGLYTKTPTSSNNVNDTLNTNAITVNTTALSANVSSIQLSPTGGGQPIDNMMPYLALNYIIAIQGYFPQRNS